MSTTKTTSRKSGAMKNEHELQNRKPSGDNEMTMPRIG